MAYQDSYHVQRNPKQEANENWKKKKMGFLCLFSFFFSFFSLRVYADRVKRLQGHEAK
jgi:hypothetical protein